MGDGARIMGVEGADDFEGLRQDTDVAVIGANEDIVRTGADAAQVGLHRT